MPVLPSQDRFIRFKDKRIHLSEDSARTNGSVHLDDSLTSLQWLQDFSILSESLASLPCSTSQWHHFPWHSQPHLNISDPLCSPSAGDTAASGVPRYAGSPITCSASGNRTGYSSLLQTVHNNQQRVPVADKSTEEVDYRSNRQVKPPYSYATLICMAMQASEENKITLSAIYNWIKENFCYYRNAEPSWQNSIRHNLSLNKCFIKVPRQKDEPGKGGFWQIDPQYADMFVNGVFRRRRMPANHFHTQKNSKHRRSSQNRINQNCRLNCPRARGRATHGGAGSGYKHVRAGTKWATVNKSPALTSHLRETEVLKGELDWAMVFDDILNGNSNDLNNLDLNLALNTLGCEVELSHQDLGQGPSCPLGKWYSDMDHQQDCWSMEMNHDTTGSDSVAGIQQHSNQPGLQQQLIPTAGRPQHGQEHRELTQFTEELLRHPWEEVKEEAPEVPITIDYTLNYCEGFYARMQPWGQ
ncbi:hypothetical protein DPEC_G00279170 [Dallia pectoralis]|uniref:Uncharacterized protein n=1 Tax=Dallia pectoralis TaxID=75939 RepID=A0ACC2FM93_DALPE|nr:hypothetical protein DPEC_G00279170 [Dallia pectoralis]